MEETKKQHNASRNNFLYITAFFALVLATWTGFLFAPKPTTIELPTAYGSYDLSDYSFEDAVYRTESAAWDSWPYQLYTPEDFANGNVRSQPRFLDKSEVMSTSHATYAIRLTLPADTYYGISMTTAEYAMRIYIDGNEIDSVGIPGSTREDTEHRSLERTYYFSPQSDTVTIIVQTANFVHDVGSGAPAFIIGSAENITARNNVDIAVSFLIVGCLMAAFLHHVGLFCLNRSRRIELIFAFCCLLLALMNKKLILMLWPNYIFSVAIRIEYVIHFLTFALLILFLECLHPKLMHKAVTRAYYALTGLYLLTLILDTTIFTRLIVGFQTASIFIIGYVFVRLAMSLRGGRLQNYLSFAGVVVLGLLGANDILYYRNIVIIPPISGQFFMAPIGMVFFTFCYSLAMSAGHAETEKAMLEAQANERQLANENAMLDHMNILKEKLMSTISHEARTPLAVLASYAGLVAMELRDKGMDEQTTADLDTIAFEAKRVANLIDSMKRMTLSSEQPQERICLDIGEVARQTAQLYMPILERSGIVLDIQLAEHLPPLLGSSAELTQVLFNLLQNARNHTESGSVAISVEHDNDSITAYITDTGTGIEPRLIPDIFERGVKGHNGGSGIGLAVCNEIVTAHGGTIQIESELGKGTKVIVVFPAYKGDYDNGQ